jgi:glycosyltransferase involved in cell wall biosynthesis
VKNLIFLSHVIPRFSGHGGSMRAGLNLQALSKDYQIYLEVLSLEKGLTPEDVPLEIRNLCVSVNVRFAGKSSPEVGSRWIKPGGNLSLLINMLRLSSDLEREYSVDVVNQIINGPVKNAEFSAIHCYSLYLATIAVKLSKLINNSSAKLVLDIDDFASKMLLRKAKLQREKLGRMRYLAECIEVKRIIKLENKITKYFNAVLLGSVQDQEEFSKLHQAHNVWSLTNGFRLSNEVSSSSEVTGKNLLFVGTLSYDANIDGLGFFLSSIWPILVEEFGREVKCIVAGRNPPPEVEAMVQVPGISLVTNPPDLTPYYRDANVIVVPLRVGGGTRIKILEAFSHHRALVSTTLGAEGLPIIEGTHYLCADTPDEFAKACIELLNNTGKRKQLAEAGYQVLVKQFSAESISAQLLAIYKAC